MRWKSPHKRLFFLYEAMSLCSVTGPSRVWVTLIHQHNTFTQQNWKTAWLNSCIFHTTIMISAINICPHSDCLWVFFQLSRIWSMCSFVWIMVIYKPEMWPFCYQGPTMTWRHARWTRYERPVTSKVRRTLNNCWPWRHLQIRMHWGVCENDYMQFLHL